LLAPVLERDHGGQHQAAEPRENDARNKKENEIWTSFASFYRFVIRDIPNQVDLP
jgi:hypothetical protein